jgi:3-oxoacyl-[acyl-carrier-protein] synthase II
MLTHDLSGLEPLAGDLLYCREPEYKNLIPPMQLRRMSKTIRIGVAAAKICLRETGLEKPDAIHIGSAYGVLDDSEKFLNNLIEQQEQTLTPTSFIQSTHNTVSGQIALLTRCHGHNLTFVHKAHSFESALLDAAVFLQNHPQAIVLAGAVEECTPTAYDILRRFGMMTVFLQEKVLHFFCFPISATRLPARSVPLIYSWRAMRLWYPKIFLRFWKIIH